MAVYDRGYRAYEGPLTGERRRFLVLPRYAFAGVFESRLFTAFFAACFVLPVGAALGIYLHHNLPALTILRMQPGQLLPINAMFFAGLMGLQSFSFGGLLTLFVGPGLISADLANNALPLYLSRPFSRFEYVLGKLSVLVVLLSLVTWIPGLLLFAIQSYLEGGEWLAANLRVGVAILAGAWLWIAVASLFALAMSAVARRKVTAQAYLLGVVLAGSMLGQAINEGFGVRWGLALSLPEIMRSVWQGLYGVDLKAPLPPGAALLTLAGVTAFSLLLLRWKLRAYEVAR